MMNDKTTEELAKEANFAAQDAEGMTSVVGTEYDIVSELLESLRADMIGAGVEYSEAEEFVIFLLSYKGGEIIPDEDWTSAQTDYFLKLIQRVQDLRKGAEPKREVHVCAIHHPAHKTLEKIERISDVIQWPYQFEYDYATVVENTKIELEQSIAEDGSITFSYGCLFANDSYWPALRSESVSTFYQDKAPYWLYLEIDAIDGNAGDKYNVRWGMDDTGLVAITCAEETLKRGQVMHLCVEREQGCEEQWDIAIDTKPIDPAQMLPGFTYDPDIASPTEFVSGEYLKAKAAFMPLFTRTEIEDLNCESVEVLCCQNREAIEASS